MGACPIRIHLVPFTCFVSWATTVVPAVSVLPTHRAAGAAEALSGAQRCVADADIGVDPSTSVAKAPHDLILAFATRDRSGLLPSAAPARSRSAEVERLACWKRIQRAAGLSRALGHVLPSCSFGPRRECWRRRTRKIPLQTEPRAPPTQGTVGGHLARYALGAPRTRTTAVHHSSCQLGCIA